MGGESPTLSASQASNPEISIFEMLRSVFEKTQSKEMETGL